MESGDNKKSKYFHQTQ